mgnify:CR=1 FL=1
MPHNRRHRRKSKVVKQAESVKETVTESSRSEVTKQAEVENMEEFKSMDYKREVNNVLGKWLFIEGCNELPINTLQCEVVRRLAHYPTFDETCILAKVLKGLGENYPPGGESKDEINKFYLEKDIDIEKVLQVVENVMFNIMFYMRYVQK